MCSTLDCCPCNGWCPCLSCCWSVSGIPFPVVRGQTFSLLLFIMILFRLPRWPIGKGSESRREFVRPSGHAEECATNAPWARILVQSALRSLRVNDFILFLTFVSIAVVVLIAPQKWPPATCNFRVSSLATAASVHFYWRSSNGALPFKLYSREEEERGTWIVLVLVSSARETRPSRPWLVLGV